MDETRLDFNDNFEDDTNLKQQIAAISFQQPTQEPFILSSLNPLIEPQQIYTQEQQQITTNCSSDASSSTNIQSNIIPTTKTRKRRRGVEATEQSSIFK